MSLTIRPVDPWDEHEMDVLQEQYVEAQRAEVPDARVYSRADSVALLRRTGAGCSTTRSPASRATRWSARPGWSAARPTTCTWPTCGPGCLRASAGGARHRPGRGTPSSTSATSAGVPPSPRPGSATARRLPALRRAARLHPGPDARSSAASGCPWTRRPWRGSRPRPPPTASGVPLRTVVGPIPDELVPGFLRPLQPDERRDADRRDRARGGPAYTRGAGRAGGGAARRWAAPG